ncbi:MAG: MaoC family dehydratase N-terminal domain-containing protein [Dehalococcoidia bacterium]|nr:MaoC family dehydratase N-terminal domain-containing protein [Dehalococcoidia bacterium]
MTQEQESAITPEMRAAVGVESEAHVNEVEKGAIIKFAVAIGDTNPIYNDEQAARNSRYGGIIAPPTFFRTMSSGPMKVDVKSPYSANLDGGSDWEYYEPVRPGDRISVTTLISNIFERPGRLGSTGTSSGGWSRSSARPGSAISRPRTSRGRFQTCPYQARPFTTLTSILSHRG